jgi:hypothetical protein
METQHAYLIDGVRICNPVTAGSRQHGIAVLAIYFRAVKDGELYGITADDIYPPATTAIGTDVRVFQFNAPEHALPCRVRGTATEDTEITLGPAIGKIIRFDRGHVIVKLTDEFRANESFMTAGKWTTIAQNTEIDRVIRDTIRILGLRD